MRNKAYIVGCGGAGSWLAHSLVKLIGNDRVILVDGDRLEKKNLDRQLFSEQDLGSNKAEALGERLKCQAEPQWFSEGIFELNREDWLLGCVDNHPSRRAILRECDRTRCRAVLCCNETTSAEAFVYLPEWKGTKLDPRVYYPTIETSNADDPRARAIGCTGEAQAANRQLVSANFMAAALAQHLFVLWEMERPKLEPDTDPFLPFKLVANLTRLETFLVGQYLEKKNNE